MDNIEKNNTTSWKCPECDELNDLTFDICWNCQHKKTDKEILIQNLEEDDINPPNIKEIYFTNFNISNIPTEKINEYKHHSLSRIDVVILILIHFLTLGIGTIIYFGIVHSKLPKIKNDDFGTFKALGFLIIPLFNIYWIWIFWLRLIDRLNFQLNIRNDSYRINSALAIGIIFFQLFFGSFQIIFPEASFLFIPFNILVNLILSPILIAKCQIAINKIIELDKSY